MANLTGSAGIVAALKGSGQLDLLFAVSIGFLAALATGVSAVLGRSRPERLYVTDIIQQFRLTMELQQVIHNPGDYGRLDQNGRCKQFVERVLVLTKQQIEQWAASSGDQMPSHEHPKSRKTEETGDKDSPYNS
jgi:hypothetical protein